MITSLLSTRRRSLPRPKPRPIRKPLRGPGGVNPAATYAVNQGLGFEIKSDSKGNQYGEVTLRDGTKMDEWTYYRQNYKPPTPRPRPKPRPKPIRRPIPKPIRRPTPRPKPIRRPIPIQQVRKPVYKPKLRPRPIKKPRRPIPGEGYSEWGNRVRPTPKPVPKPIRGKLIKPRPVYRPKDQTKKEELRNRPRIQGK